MLFRTLIHAICIGFVFSPVTLTGCGGDSGPTVIEPTENYEPTDEEKVDEQRAEELMERGDTSE